MARKLNFHFFPKSFATFWWIKKGKWLFTEIILLQLFNTSIRPHWQWFSWFLMFSDNFLYSLFHRLFCFIQQGHSFFHNFTPTFLMILANNFLSTISIWAFCILAIILGIVPALLNKIHWSANNLYS